MGEASDVSQGARPPSVAQRTRMTLFYKRVLQNHQKKETRIKRTKITVHVLVSPHPASSLTGSTWDPLDTWHTCPNTCPDSRTGQDSGAGLEAGGHRGSSQEQGQASPFLREPAGRSPLPPHKGPHHLTHTWLCPKHSRVPGHSETHLSSPLPHLQRLRHCPRRVGASPRAIRVRKVE